jgi:heme/copper-type cytochrome/quinol oxidase subunit 2
MRGLVVVETGGDYEKWLQEQTTFAQSVAALNKKSKSEVKLVSNLEDTQSPLNVTAQ